jgi:hypothetical protein
MKKLFSTLVVCLIAICSYGQMSLECDTTFFKCSEIFQDITKYNTVWKINKQDNIKWATNLKGVFPLDKDNLLHFTYIVRTDSIIDMEVVKNVCTSWYGIGFSSQNSAIKEQTENYILGSGQFSMIGQTTIPAVFYYKIIKVHAQIDVIMRFKENRIKFEIIGRHYQYISGDSSGRSHNDLLVPGTVFPFAAEEKQANKEVFSQSYINFCNNSLSLSRSFLDYLNKNIHPSFIQDNEDW